MNVLAFDTSGPTCSAAVWGAGDARSVRSEERGSGHAELLIPLLQTVLGEAGLGFKEIDLFAVTRGPGAFAGIRVGVAAARGLSVAAARPAIGVTAFEALAAEALAVAPAQVRGATLLAALDARRGQIYAQAFADSLAPVTGFLVLRAEELAAALPSGPIVVVGSAAEGAARALREAGREGSALPLVRAIDPRCVAELAASRFARGGVPRSLQPLYLRPPGVAAVAASANR